MVSTNESLPGVPGAGCTVASPAYFGVSKSSGGEIEALLYPLQPAISAFDEDSELTKAPAQKAHLTSVTCSCNLLFSKSVHGQSFVEFVVLEVIQIANAEHDSDASQRAAQMVVLYSSRMV